MENTSLTVNIVVIISAVYFPFSPVIRKSLDFRFPQVRNKRIPAGA